MAHIHNDATIPTKGVIYQSKGKHMLYLSEYSAGSVYYRTNNLIRILHLVFIIVMLSLFLAHNKILLKHVCVNLAALVSLLVYSRRYPKYSRLTFLLYPSLSRILDRDSGSEEAIMLRALFAASPLARQQSIHCLWLGGGAGIHFHSSSTLHPSKSTDPHHHQICPPSSLIFLVLQYFSMSELVQMSRDPSPHPPPQMRNGGSLPGHLSSSMDPLFKKFPFAPDPLLVFKWMQPPTRAPNWMQAWTYYAFNIIDTAKDYLCRGMLDDLDDVERMPPWSPCSKRPDKATYQLWKQAVDNMWMNAMPLNASTLHQVACCT